MGQMKWIGGVIFLILVFAGYTYFKDYSKKAQAKAEQTAIVYLMSLMTEDTAVNINQETGGPVVHPWKLAANPSPSQQEIEEKVGLERTSNGDRSFTWTLHGDPTGGTNVKEYNVTALYDQQGALQSLSGLRGTVTYASSAWQQ